MSGASRTMFATPGPIAQTVSDTAVQATDGDAAQARLSAVRKSYLQDPFITAFVPRAHLVPARPPLINIGTYVRSEAIDSLVKSWLNLDIPGGPKQIVSLGAGSDTRFWRIATGPLKGTLSKYVEVDFPEVTSRKAAVIRKSKVLHDVLGPSIKVERGGTGISSEVYHLVPADLRLPEEQALGPLLEILSSSSPTLFIAECVFAYIPEQMSSNILRWFSNKFELPSGIIYEMFKLQDSFGKVMRANLQSRNVELPGVAKFVDLDTLQKRFTQENFEMAQALTLKDIRQQYVGSLEASRISRLEFLDEVEELELVLDHYAVSWGAKMPPTPALRNVLEAWGTLKLDGNQN